jgi:hypothetical protein
MEEIFIHDEHGPHVERKCRKCGKIEQSCTTQMRAKKGKIGIG